MQSKSGSFQNKLVFGKEGEKVVRSWLKSKGYVLLPASLIDNGGAPILEGANLILPDILAWRKGVEGWVEVKTKSTATKHVTNPKRWEHGLPLRHWNAYKEIEKQTCISVHLAVLELETNKLLFSSIEHLEAHSRISKMQGEWHIFLDRGDFDWYGINLSLPEPIVPIAKRTRAQGKPPDERQLSF